MTQPLRVLLLEDQDTDAELMVRELKRAGFDPVWDRVDTEEELLRCLDQPNDRPYDLILSDNSMPTFDALAALKCLQQRRVDIPFIIVSGSIGEEQAVALLHHGASDYIMKDRIDRLGSAVGQVLEKKRLRDDNRAAHAALEARTKALLLSQERLRALASDLTLTEQRERRKLASDLHDYLAQLLVAGRMKLRRAAASMTDQSGSQLLQEIDRIFQDSLQYTRTLIADLAPPALQEFGLTHALHWLSEHMRAHGLTVQIRLEADGVELPDDQAILVFQSVRELLFNVVKHAQVKTATVIWSKHSNDELHVTVADDGKGIDREAAAVRDSNSGRFGLFSISERMQAMGGRFEMESKLGQGTRATMILPCWPQTRSSSPPAERGIAQDRQDRIVETPAGDLSARRTDRRSPHETESTASRGSASARGIRVLLVDDHAIVRQGIRSLLDSHDNIRVVGEASDGRRAIDLTKELRPDVVVMDVNLPVVDGMAATSQIIRDCPETVVIALSVHDDRHIVESMLAAGVVAFVSKGSVTEELYKAIEQAVLQREAEQEIAP
jgi:signal transduction histidine kinase